MKLVTNTSMPPIRHFWPLVVALLLGIGFWWVVLTNFKLPPDSPAFFATGFKIIMVFLNPLSLLGISTHHLHQNRFPRDAFRIISLASILLIVSSGLCSFFFDGKKIATILAGLVFPIVIVSAYLYRFIHKHDRTWIDWTKLGGIGGCLGVYPLLVFLEEFHMLSIPFKVFDKNPLIVLHILILSLLSLNLYHLHLRQQQKLLERQEARIGEIGDV